MNPAVGALLGGLIDYAGLFAPASLPMDQAVRGYAAHRRGPERWMLGRFVVPVARLEEFEAALAGLGPEERGEGPWELSGLLGAGVAREPAAAEAFNARRRGAVVIRSLEVRVDGVAQVAAARAAVAPSFELFCEVPLPGDLRWLLAAVRSAEAKAKVRTGGVVPQDIPEPDALLKFLEQCAAIRLPFKATAGLHHPVRGDAPLTYEPESPRATLYGYLNVLLAAAALWTGRTRMEARAILGSQDRGGLALGADEVRWNASRFGAEELARVRREFCLSVGSCSFTEPVEEIRALGAPLDPAAQARTGAAAAPTSEHREKAG